MIDPAPVGWFALGMIFPSAISLSVRALAFVIRHLARSRRLDLVPTNLDVFAALRIIKLSTGRTAASALQIQRQIESEWKQKGLVGKWWYLSDSLMLNVLRRMQDEGKLEVVENGELAVTPSSWWSTPEQQADEDAYKSIRWRKPA